MSCCGCASRVLKLQSEIRSWKTKLADEKREKKTILKWILAIFGYDVRVDIERETRSLRLQATENKEAVGKALIKLGLAGAGENDLGMMVMELKLEDHEFYEPFEDTREIPEFPILEINSMPTSSQPMINVAGVTTLGHLSPHMPPPMTITTPIEMTPQPLPMNAVPEQEVVYLAGNFEDGATLEGINGQSYIIVRNEVEDTVPIPMQLDYGVPDDNLVSDGNGVYFQTALPIANEPAKAISYLPPGNTLQFSLPTVVTPAPAAPVVTQNLGIVPESVIEQLQSSVLKPPSVGKPVRKPKSSLSSTKETSQIPSKASKKSKSTEIKCKVKAQKSDSSPNPINQPNSHPVSSKITIATPPRASDDFGYTLREKAEVYVLQKADEAVEKVGNAFRCTVCTENRCTYPNYEMAKSHAISHYESKPYKCKFCPELFPTQKKFMTHRATAHSKAKGSGISPPVSSSRLITLLTSPSSISPANVTGSFVNAKTVSFQPPCDNNHQGPVQISSEVLAALLRKSTTFLCTPNRNMK